MKIKRTRLSRSALLAATLVVTSGASAEPEPAPAPTKYSLNLCNREAVYHEHDFTLGRWDAYNELGGVTVKLGEAEFKKVVNGCGIQLHWTPPSKNPAGVRLAPASDYWEFFGLFAYSAQKQAWVYSFVTNDGWNNYFIGQAVKPGDIRYDTQLITPEGVLRMRHWSLTLMADGRIDMHAEKSDDQGRTWLSEYHFYLKRVN